MTHFIKSLLNRNLLVPVAFTVALAPQALMAADELCPRENATFRGTYVVYGTGTRVGVGPVAAVGEITSDGKGNTFATYAASVNGVIHPKIVVTGSYTVNGDCTGSSAESDGSHYNFVVAPDGSKVTWIRTDKDFVTSGTEVRLKHLREEDEE